MEKIKVSKVIKPSLCMTEVAQISPVQSWGLQEIWQDFLTSMKSGEGLNFLEIPHIISECGFQPSEGLEGCLSTTCLSTAERHETKLGFSSSHVTGRKCGLLEAREAI